MMDIKKKRKENRMTRRQRNKTDSIEIIKWHDDDDDDDGNVQWRNMIDLVDFYTLYIGNCETAGGFGCI